MSLLYLTADQVGIETGGGIVTKEESEALKTLGDCTILDRPELQHRSAGSFAEVPEPWSCDLAAKRVVCAMGNTAWSCPNPPTKYKLAHIYAGCFTKTVAELQINGCKVVATIAAHDVEVSRREHEKLGIPFAEIYPHLCEPELWQRYCGGYMAADVIVCPGSVPAAIIRKQGYKGRIEIIPHGCDMPEKFAPLPKTFTCGYLGSATAADKGVLYLLQAWKKLNSKDAVLKIAGRDSTSPQFVQMVQRFGGGNIQLLGWQKHVSDFYNQISLLVQPSCTEGFGCEVLESQAYGRMALCSLGAGACDTVPETRRFPACNTDALVALIHSWKDSPFLAEKGLSARENAKQFTWDKVRSQYVALWKSLLEEC